MNTPTTETTKNAPLAPAAPALPPGPAPAKPTAALALVPTDGGALNAFASEANFAAGQRMGKALCKSTLVPAQYRGEENLANCVIALEIAARIGASVFMVMQNLDIIHGRPSWRATFLIATVNASGRFTPLRFRFEGKPNSDEWGCRAYAKDRESGEECPGSLITIALAKAEGWYSRNGTKWRTMPEQMLMYRAAAFWTRVYAPELSLGMQTSDEVIDTVGYPVDDAPAVAATRGSAAELQAKLAEVLAEAPAAQGEQPAAPANGGTAPPAADVHAAPAPATPQESEPASARDFAGEGDALKEAIADAKSGDAEAFAKVQGRLEAFEKEAPKDIAAEVRRFFDMVSGKKKA